MKTISSAINMAIEKAFEHGNSIVEIERGWSEMNEVVYMKKPLTEYSRNDLKTINSLEYFKYNGSPHNKAEEYFIDNDLRVSIAFPIK